MVPIRLTLHRHALILIALPIYLWIIAFITLFYWITYHHCLDQQKIELDSKARLVASVLQPHFLALNSPNTILLKEIQKLEQTHKVSLTVARPDGQVLFSDEMWPEGNILDKPDVTDALLDRSSVSQDKSGSSMEKYLFTTVVIKDSSKPRILIRAGSSLSRAFQSYQAFFIYPGLFFLVLLTFLHGLLWFIATNLKKALVNMREPLAAYVHGDYHSKLRKSSNIGIEVSKLERTVIKLGYSLRNQLNKERTTQIERSTIFTNLKEGILIINNDHQIIDLNESAAQLFHSIPEQVIGKRLEETIRNSDLQTLINEVFSRKKHATKNIVLLYKEKTYLSVQASLLRGNNQQILGMLLFINNISESVAIEQVRKEFVANVSHELKTPIAAIQGYVETLREGALLDTAVNSKFLEKIQRNNERLASIVDDMLTLSGIEGNPELSSLFAQGSLVDLVKETIDALVDIAASKSIVLNFSYSEDIALKMHRSLLGQALYNLIENAIKYSPEKSQISILFRQENSRVFIEVADQGAGIDQKHLVKLFNRFYRADEGRSRNEGGSGLGLAIVKHIVLVHNGFIEAHSELNKGSRFIISLPMV